MDKTIPREWTLTTIDNVVDYLGSGISRPFYSDQVGVPVLRSNNVKDGCIVLDELKYWHEVDPRGANLETVTPMNGDILINFVNGSAKELGKSAVFRGEPPGCIVSTNFFIVRLRRELALPDYISAYLQSDYYRDWLTEVVGFTGQGSFNQKELRRLQIPLPPLSEQKAIAAVLSTWDRGIRQLTDLIAAKLRFKQGLMQQLLTGKRRFKKFVLSDEQQSSAAGSFPKDWGLHRLGDITEEVRRKNDAGVTRVLTASGNHGLVDQRDYFNRSVAGKSLAGYYLLKRGEFAYNRSLMKGYPYGATKRLDFYDEGVVSTLYLCFRISSDECNSDWLAHVFESDVFNSQLRGIAKMGARAHGLLNVAASEFFHMILPMPSKEEQAAIASTLDMADKEISLLEKQLEALKQQKKGLMQKLLTGEVRVKL